MNAKLKVCGMRQASNIMDVSSLSPDYMGFIFYKKSPRYVGDEFSMPAELNPSITRVGVFVNETTPVILDNAKKFGFEMVQLHGDEAEDQCSALRSEGLRVIKAVSVGKAGDLGITEKYADAVDFFLFDTKGKYYGGNALAFDWQLLTNYHQRKPFFLSGGINPDNVSATRFLSDMNLHAIDVNSGVELSPGLKDLEKVRELKTRFLKAFKSNERL
jgi:phosphoribosylanthranilate isomerase